MEGFDRASNVGDAAESRVAVADDRDVARRPAHVRARVDDVGEEGEADVGVAETTGGDAVPGHERAFEGAGARDELGAEGVVARGHHHAPGLGERPTKALRGRRRNLNRGAWGDVAAATTRETRPGSDPGANAREMTGMRRGGSCGGEPQTRHRDVVDVLRATCREASSSPRGKVDLHSAPRVAHSPGRDGEGRTSSSASGRTPPSGASPTRTSGRSWTRT